MTEININDLAEGGIGLATAPVVVAPLIPVAPGVGAAVGAAGRRRRKAARQAAAPSRARDFYELTKPRMNFLVVATTLVGYFMAAGDSIGWVRLLHTLIGTALTAAASGVLNQYMERSYDALMPRTADRALAAGRVKAIQALTYGILLGVAGIVYLYLMVNPLTAAIGAATLGSYLFVYTPLKRVTTLCTIVGAVPGALPPVMGWTAVQDRLGPEALVLFGILFLWQMPHFLAIAVLYKDDYAAGGFKMLPVVDESLRSTSRQIMVYAMSLIPMSLMPAAMGMAGMAYFLGALVLGIGFIAFGYRCAMSRTRVDARRLFFASIIYLPLLLGLLVADRLPGHVFVG